MRLHEVAAACEGFSGADLSALLADAQLEAVHEVLARPGAADEVNHKALHKHALKLLWDWFSNPGLAQKASAHLPVHTACSAGIAQVA